MILDQIIQKVNDNDFDFFEALSPLVDNQIKVKKEKVYAAGIKISHFPFIKTIDDFDFSFQPSISKALIKDFCFLRFMENNENTLDRRLKHFNSYSLLIIDELGHVILDEESASDLFQLIQMRYEHHPTIITTNYNISQWNTIFKNNKIALDAMFDRLLHHSNIVTQLMVHLID